MFAGPLLFPKIVVVKRESCFVIRSRIRIITAVLRIRFDTLSIVSPTCVFVSKKSPFSDSGFEITCYNKSSKDFLKIFDFIRWLPAFLIEMSELLEQIKSPDDLKKLSAGQLKPLAEQIRRFIISSVSKTGGHLASNLGVVELTLALHYVFDFKTDKLLWDVGHQC